MPGLGHIYCGQVRRGLLLWSCVCGALIAALVAWGRWLFVPVMPVAVLAVSYTLLQLSITQDLSRFVRQEGDTYALRPVNHWLSYLAVFLGLAVLPLVLTAQVLGGFFVGSFEIDGHAMFPRLLPGDRVLFERDGFAEGGPRAGDLVVVQRNIGSVLVARVIATPGHTVHLREGRPVVNGRTLDRARLGALSVPRFGLDDQARLSTLAGYVESMGERRYVVTYAQERQWLGDPPPETLGQGEYYVLADNRDAALGRRWYGKVERREVQGRPRYIWASFDDVGRARPGRVGLHIR